MPPNPIVLAFDTSAAHVAAALLSDGEIVGEHFEERKRGQDAVLMPVLEDLLAPAGLTWQDLDAIGVGIGPGNFTGVRLSVAAAKGLGLSLGIPVIGVSGFDQALLGAGQGAIAAIPASRGQLYLGRDTQTAGLYAVDGFGAAQSGASIAVGPAAQALADATGLPTRPTAYSVAVATAMIAADRFGAVQDPPKPLYLKAADAAPSKTPAPAIVP